MVKRVLGAVRESRSRETSTSPEVQRDKIEGWANLHDAEIIKITVDRDVSGKTVPPWDRPELGPWMSQPEKFDVLCASRLDRVCRNAADFMNLIKWSKKTGVDLVFVREGFDLTTTAGKMAATILAVIAEYDWDNIKENTRDGQRKAIQQGRWKGGTPPYGYRPVKEARRGIVGWYLEEDPETSGILREVYERVTSHTESITEICDDLNRRGVLSPADYHRVRSKKEAQGTKWAAPAMIRMLRSRALLGEYQTNDDDTIRDENTGLPISKADPLFSPSEWTELQSSLDRISKRKVNNRKGMSLLRDVAYCAVCGRKMYHATSGGGSYYRCSSFQSEDGRCMNKMVRAGYLEAAITSSFISAFGDEPMMRRKVVPGEDHSDDIAAVKEQIANLSGNLARVKPGSEAATATLALLEEKETALEALRSLPTKEETVAYVPTGETAKEHWERLSEAERGQLLRDHDVIYFYGHTAEDNHFEAVIWGEFDRIRESMTSGKTYPARFDINPVLKTVTDGLGLKNFQR